MDPVTEWLPSERALVDAYARGTLVDLGDGEPTSPDFDVDSWGEDRNVRAEVIAWLLCGGTPAEAGYTPKVRLAGARVQGRLDLDGARVGAELQLYACWLDDDVDLTDARTRGIFIVACHLDRVGASRLDADGTLSLSRSTATTLDLPGATINGQLDLNGAELVNADGTALSGDRVTVTKGMFCRDEFSAVGEVRLPGASITGTLDLSGATLSNPDGIAFGADGLTVNGSMFCRGLTATGEVRMLGAHIDGQLDLSGATLNNPDGDAFAAEDVHVSHSLFLADGFTTLGTVNLDGAFIKGQLNLNGATLRNPDGVALIAPNMVVGEDLFCRLGLSIDGEVVLYGAQIKGRLDLAGAGFADACLNGLTYGGIEPPEASDKLLGWLDRDPHGFHPQPYEQLASYLRSLGHDRHARQTLLAKQRRRRRSLPLWRRGPGLLLDLLSGYGYAPGRSLALLLGAVTAGWAYFWLHGLPPSVSDAEPLNGAQLLLYVTDVIVPTSPFGQEALFAPMGPDLAVVASLQAFGWLLSVALLPAITRTLGRT